MNLAKKNIKFVFRDRVKIKKLLPKVEVFLHLENLFLQNDVFAMLIMMARPDERKYKQKSIPMDTFLFDRGSKT